MKFEPYNYLAKLEGQVMLPPFYRRKNKTQSGHMAGYEVVAHRPGAQASYFYTLLKLKVYLLMIK